MSIQTGFDPELATRMLSKAGQQMYLRAKADDQVFDPVTGKVTANDAPVDTPFMGYPFPITEEYAASVNPTLIKQGDLLVFMPPVREPLMTDDVVINSEVYDMINIQPVLKSGLAMLYILHIRK